MTTETRTRVKLTATRKSPWAELIQKIGPGFRERAAEHDQRLTFVERNYVALKEHRIFAAGIPEELGGGGASHADICSVIRLLAHYCSSTALAHSMHQHLVAANVWKYRKGQGAEEMLRRVAEQQPVLVSTGARDWLESNGEMTRTARGFLVSASKAFASQSSVGNILVTSAPYEDPEKGSLVHHFSVPFTADGLSIMNDWDTMGMRGTGSHTVRLEEVFVPDEAIVLTRARGEFHPFWNVILTVAMPLIMAAYVGIAERAAEIALATARKRKNKTHLPYEIARMNNTLTTAQVHHNDMIRIADNFNFEPIQDHAHEILTRKTIVADSCIATVSKAMDIAGGQGFYRSFGLERLFRDVHGAKYHPLQEMDQLLFCGNYLLDQDMVK
ncbi:MAG: acyl-CoA/acyl-ACP dehydrogenase [Ignavibacteria bacterium]|nr:acyl-CoA/acyl-ACP dehydrogenase [Ignavibacteria bacterium]